MHRPTLSGKRISRGRLIAAAAALVATGALGVTGAVAAGGKATAAPGCQAGGLVIWINTQGDGAAGSVFYRLELTNQSGHTCTLRGFPGVSGVTLQGKQLGKAASRNHARSVKTITLTKGSTANAPVQIVNVGNFPKSACRPVNAAGLRVFAPNASRAKTVPFPFRACSKPGARYLSVQAVRKGR